MDNDVALLQYFLWTEFHKNNQNLLSASYVLFIARYLFVCDKRQIYLMQNLLYEGFSSKEQFEKLPSKIISNLLDTLNDQELEAVHGIFTDLPKKYTKKPDEEMFVISHRQSSPLTTYTFRILTDREKFITDLSLSLFKPDKILLPITCGLFAKYIVDSLNKIDQVQSDFCTLANFVIDLLNEYKRVNCRTKEGLIEVPNSILNRSGISDTSNLVNS